MGGVKECLRFEGNAEFHPLMVGARRAAHCGLRLQPGGAGGLSRCPPAPCPCPTRPPCLTSTPPQYLEGLAAAVERHGGKIYEGTKAWNMGGR